jgi:thioredoxin-related protein
VENESDPPLSKTSGIENGVEWIDFETALALSETEKRKVFIDIYTDWCGWCKKMDATTFSEDTIAKVLNNDFYAVKLDAETKDIIEFNNMEFKFNREYDANELAISLLGGKMGYPSYIILDEEFKVLSQPIQSYLTTEQLLPILDYFGKGIYNQRSWQEYLHNKNKSKINS